MTRVVSLHRSQAISGVRVAGTRLCQTLPNCVPLVIGEGIGPTDTAGVCTWPARTPPMEQVRRVLGAIRRLGARAVVTNDLPHGALAASLATDLRCVGWFHGDHPRDHGYYERVSPLCDAWAAVSDSIARTVSAHDGRAGAVAPCPVELRAEGSLIAEHGPLRLLFAGWLDANKRPLDLPVLCAHLARLGVDYTLEIAGDGPLASVLAERMNDLVRTGRVRLHGTVSGREMAGLYERCDVLVLPSQSEGCPLVVGEAMVAGRAAAVSTGCGGAVDAITHGVDGLIFPIGRTEQLAEQLACTPRAQLAAMGRAARATALRAWSPPALRERFRCLIEASLRIHRAAAQERWPAFVRTLGLLGVGDLAQVRETFAQANSLDAEQLSLRVPNDLSPRQRLMRATIERLEREGRTRIALYGAGAHTTDLGPVLTRSVVAIVDDHAEGTMHGLAVVRPDQVDELGIDAVVLSSDGFEELLAERAASWAAGRPVVRLYTNVEMDDAPRRAAG